MTILCTLYSCNSKYVLKIYTNIHFDSRDIYVTKQKNPAKNDLKKFKQQKIVINTDSTESLLITEDK